LDNQRNLFIAEPFDERIRKVGLGSPTLSLANVTAANTGNYWVVVSSPYGNATSAVASLTVVLPPLTATIIPPTATNPVTAIQFKFTGTTGSNYVLQYTLNLSQPSTWLPLFTNTPDANGNWTFTDTNATTCPEQFFRIASP
jgi:p-aminobenzoyl-glutamate transporter AbgT